MNALHLQAARDTPLIQLDQSRGIFEFSGRSIPEDADTFYAPVIAWLEQYICAPNPDTHFVFKLEYYNTVSLRKILEIFRLLDKIPRAQITWYVHPDEDDVSHLIDLLKTPLILQYF